MEDNLFFLGRFICFEMRIPLVIDCYICMLI